MMFQADTAFAAELIALVSGTALLVWAGRKEDVCCKGFAKIVAYFTIVASILALLCTSYYTLRYWEDGHFRHPGGTMGMGRMMGGMPGKGMMMDCPMMKEMMQQMMEKKQGMAAPKEHDEHH